MKVKDKLINNLDPGKNDLWFLPLGGTGEIGMNMNLYGHDGQWLMVDCGVTFNAELNDGSQRIADVVSADPAFIAKHHEQLAGIVITHAHEDHIGALAHLWRRLKAPVYTTAFTAEFLKRKLAQAGLTETVPVHIIDSGARVEIGPFNVEWLPLTHSLPEPHSMVIRTDAGNVFHTADWKIDPQPVLGLPFNPKPFKALANENIQAMVCDSTNSTRPGRSISEGACFDGLSELIEQAENRVVVACFGSNIARLITLGKIAQQTGRYIALLGRSLQNMVSCARVTGIWPEDIKIAEPQHLAYLPRHEVLAIATGSQGEPRTALTRLANNSHFDLEIESGDRVIFSSITIPGNETAVARMISNLDHKGIDVFEAGKRKKPIHASGHPCADEVADLYSWVKPHIAIPVHGEAEHLQANARIAKSQKVPQQLIGTNGDLYVLSGQAKIVKGAVKTGRISLVN